jgi:hypothetical protein
MPRMQGGDLDEEQANKAIMGEVSDPDTEVHKPGVVGPPPMDTVRGGPVTSVAPNLPPGGAAGGDGGVDSSGARLTLGPGIGGGLGGSTSLMGGFAGGGSSGSWSK